MSLIQALRKKYHQAVCQQVLYWKAGDKPSIADVSSNLSIELAKGIVERIGLPLGETAVKGQTAGKNFESLTRDFLAEALQALAHLRPGKWQFSVQGDIASFVQYAHLADVAELVQSHKALQTAFGDYVVKPDIVIGRQPVSDEEINQQAEIVATNQPPSFTPFRAQNNDGERLILHASISCKLTLRSDRSQNARTEGLNLIRNRKGHTPHIAIVTAEPMPTRIASLALGTGDIDCVYHFALDELMDTVKATQNEALIESLMVMVDGKRLRDIADLPFDLAA